MKAPQKRSRLYLAIHRRIALFLKLILAIGALLLVFQGRYQASIEVLGILAITLLPTFFGNRFKVVIPY